MSPYQTYIMPLTWPVATLTPPPPPDSTPATYSSSSYTIVCFVVVVVVAIERLPRHRQRRVRVQDTALEEAWKARRSANASTGKP